MVINTQQGCVYTGMHGFAGSSHIQARGVWRERWPVSVHLVQWAHPLTAFQLQTIRIRLEGISGLRYV